MICAENWQQKWASLPTLANKSPNEIVIASTGLSNQQLSAMGLNAVGGSLGYTLVKAELNKIKMFFEATWSDDLLRTASEIIYDEFNYLTAVEFKAFIGRVLTGHYTDNKNLSPAILTQWLRLFRNEILTARAQIKRPALEIDPATGKPYEPLSAEKSQQLWDEHIKPIINKFVEIVENQTK